MTGKKIRRMVGWRKRSFAVIYVEYESGRVETVFFDKEVVL